MTRLRGVQKSGPEEESLYAATSGNLEPAYIDQLIGTHDEVITSISQFLKFSENERHTTEEQGRAEHHVCGRRPYLGPCEGLVLMADPLPRKEVREIQKNRKNAPGFFKGPFPHDRGTGIERVRREWVTWVGTNRRGAPGWPVPERGRFE